MSFDDRIGFRVFLGKNANNTIYNNFSDKEERLRFVQLFLDGTYV